ncbi:UNVERIFIED_ORG: hypothetical protein GGD59_002284 [Rhizobium esperanzae]
MGKFKKGDRVRLIEDRHGLVAGDVGTLQEDDDGAPFVKWDKTGIAKATASRKLELIPAWQPKVGDRVRWRELFVSKMYTKGKVYEIKGAAGAHMLLTDDDRNSISGSHHWGIAEVAIHFDHVPAITIEAGKFYKTRDGRKVGPVTVDEFKIVSSPEFRNHWYDNGLSYLDGTQSDTDLIAEWVDEPAAPASNDNAAPAKFKVGDRVFAKFAEISGNGTIIRVDDHDEIMPYLVDIDGETSVWCYAEDVAGQLAPTKPTAIVALIEDGQPKPAARPFVHTTESAAKAEADRLAGIAKGQQFGVYILTTTSQEAVPTYKHEWQRLAAKGEKIAAIKELRAVTGMQLKPAKDVVEHFVEYPYGAAA